MLKMSISHWKEGFLNNNNNITLRVNNVKCYKENGDDTYTLENT